MSAARATLAGLSGSLVGIGLARFAYTPLLPALITAGWFPSSQAAYLGAANLAGYLAGALGARPLARRAAAATVLRAMMVLVTVAFFACAAPISFWWFFAWRAAAGGAGGALMVLAAPTVLPHVPPPGRRGLAGGAIFTGVGLGIAALGDRGAAAPARRTHLDVDRPRGALAAATAVAWGGWPREAAPRPRAGPGGGRPPGSCCARSTASTR